MGDQMPIASAIPAYGGTVFISYARADDERPPFDDTTQGWVTFFWHQLRFELTNAGVPQADLWLDRYEIDPSEDFTQKIEAALREARLVITILSPNWIQRPWCRKEIDRFVELRAGGGDDIVRVNKLDLPANAEIPPPLRNREGYQFFEKEPTGDIREFYWRGLQDQKAYFNVLLKMARRISRSLMPGPRPPSPPKPAKGKAIYVAAPADELRDAWQRLCNDLEGSGYEVLPPLGRLPDTAQAALTAARDGMAKAVLSVHFLGESEGVKPDGSDETLTRLQLRLARERGTADPAFPRVLWTPKWLTDRSKPKRDPFQVVERFGGLTPGDEVYAEEVTDLSQWLRGRLQQPPPPPTPPPASLLVASASPDDDELVGVLANRLQSPEIKVYPVFAGDPPPAGDSVAIVPWGKADAGALKALLAVLPPKKPTVLRLPGGDEQAKRRFFLEGVYVEPLESLPADRAAGRTLLGRLEILGANGTNHT